MVVIVREIEALRGQIQSHRQVDFFCNLVGIFLGQLLGGLGLLWRRWWVQRLRPTALLLVLLLDDGLLDAAGCHFTACGENKRPDADAVTDLSRVGSEAATHTPHAI